MKQNSFLSKEELLLQCNTIKRRQERIIQVRQQSKQMSAAILDKVKREAQRQCEEIENQVLSEIRNYHQKELEYSRQQYEKCISEINQRHYLQQININNRNSQTVGKKTLQNSSPVKSASSTNNDGKRNKPLEQKSSLKSLEQHASTARNTNKKLNEKKVRLPSPEKPSRNIIIDSDDDGVRHTILNFRKHSPEVKHLKSLQGDDNRPRCRKKSPCSNTHKPKLIHSKAIDDHALINDKSSKTQIDEMYNHLVHDRIRILEQKDKILDRQTMFLPNGISMTEKTPRFSEYFARFHRAKISSTDIISSSTSRKENEIKGIMNDMERVKLKKKLLKEELNQPKDANNSKTVSLTEETQHDKKQDSPVSSEKPITNSSSNKNSPPSNSDDSSKKISPRNRLCPSPIPKTAINDDDTSRESNKKLKKLPKHRHCRHKSRHQAIQITVSKDKKSVISTFNDNISNTQQNGTNSSSSTSKDFQQNVTQPVKLVVNVLPSADCRIEIKNNTSDKRYVRGTSKQHAEKVKDWRTIFKNQDKLTESSYYSPPEYNKAIENISSEEYERREVTPPSSTVAPKDIGFYVRKLLLMSPESIDNLNVSSCNTTLIDDSSRTTSIDSNATDDISPQRQKVSPTETAPKKNQLHDAGNNHDDTEHVKQLLFKCLKLATAKSDDINLTTFKSIDSSCDNKSFGNFPKASELNDSNTSYENFITTAIRRLLPLYQNSLDDNLDYTVHSQQTLNRTEDQSEVNISKDSAYMSTSAYLHKFVSSLSNASEKPNAENRDIIAYLKQCIESQSSPEKENKILEDSYDSANDVPSKDASYTSLPSVDELIRKGLISKAYALDDTQNEPKEFIDEEEFVRKMLQVNFTSKESHSKDDGDQSKSNDNDDHQSEPDDKYATDIRREFRKLGLNWMDTTLQRTLQASVINSTSSAEDSAGPLRSNTHFSSGYQASISSNLIIPQQQPKQHSREVLNISPITVPDLQLSVPQCFRKN
ncbi:general transcriptional corepressor trfA-like isoform X2 [Planococcus citri]|uniref:general transcriptional corepressor trfA-like isoform X2 n=1 Tax=Planococcus citri TaxID=170843 RepID=UPI0031F89F58